jgi:hypothetical protein
MWRAQRHITAADTLRSALRCGARPRGAFKGRRFRATSANSVAYAPLLRVAATLYAMSQYKKEGLMKRVFVVIAAIMFSYPIMSQNVVRDYNGVSYDVKTIKLKSLREKENDTARLILNGDISFLKNKIDYLSLACLSKEELRILRNCIFAQYGYSFKADDLRDYFKKFPWYHEKSGNISVSQIDNDNVDTITLFENIDSITESNITNKLLVGWWHDVPGWPADYSRRILFYKDNHFVFIYSNMRELPEIISFSGMYEIRGHELVLTMTNKDLVDHDDQIVCEPPHGCNWKTAKYTGDGVANKIVKIKLQEPIVMHFPVSNIINNDNSETAKYKIRIGGWYFYKFDTDPEKGYSELIEHGI